MKENSAIIIVDMINDYAHSNGDDYCENSEMIKDNIYLLKDYANKNNIPLFYANTSVSSPISPVALKWGLSAFEQSWGSCLIDELKDLKENEFIIKKESYDAFYNTNLNKILKMMNINNIYIAGVHSHVCVLLTAASAFNYGYEVCLIEDATTTNKKEKHDFAVNYVNSLLGHTKKIYQIL